MKNSFALAVKAIVIRDGRFLVLHRSKKEMEESILNKNQCWDLPGGGVHFYEKNKSALMREIWEETRLKTEMKFLYSCYDIIKLGIHMTILTYVCLYKGGEVILSDEHDAFYWLTIDEMEQMHIPDWMIRDFKKASKLCAEHMQYNNL